MIIPIYITSFSKKHFFIKDTNVKKLKVLPQAEAKGSQHFSWRSLEAALLISTFCSLFTGFFSSVDLRKKLPSIKH
jgi:hypothetical protein